METTKQTKDQNSNNKSEIETTIQNYFRGYLEADAERLAKAFHPSAKLFSVSEGKLETTEIADWLKNLRDRKAKGDIRKAGTRIDSIEITGDAAVAKTILSFPKFRFVDYLSLLQIGRDWVIMNKTYTMKET